MSDLTIHQEHTIRLCIRAGMTKQAISAVLHICEETVEKYFHEFGSDRDRFILEYRGR